MLCLPQVQRNCENIEYVSATITVLDPRCILKIDNNESKYFFHGGFLVW